MAQHFAARFVVHSGGALDYVGSILETPGKPARLLVHDGVAWLASECRPATLYDFDESVTCADRFWPKAVRYGFTVACSCTRLHAGKNWVKTPCCQGGRRGVNSTDTVICPTCGWYWAVFVVPGGTRWYSKGFGTRKR